MSGLFGPRYAKNLLRSITFSLQGKHRLLIGLAPDGHFPFREMMTADFRKMGRLIFNHFSRILSPLKNDHQSRNGLMKTPLTTIVTLLFVVLLARCAKKGDEGKQQAEQSGNTAASSTSSAVAGIHWTVPQGWTQQGERPMRVTTYTVPSPGNDVEAGECGVFYFGKDQGGSVNDNLSRWISQFENGGKHQFSSKEINGMNFTLIQISGTYLSPSGPAMESQGKKAGYQLLGAIVEAPQGLVFFKFTGPEKTVTASESAFNQLVNSVSLDQQVASGK